MALAEKIHAGLKKHVAKEKERAGEKKESKREVSHFRVEPAEGGHMVETHFKEKPGRMGMGHYEEPHKSIHKTMASAAKHMKETCNCGNCNSQETGVAVGSQPEKGMKDAEPQEGED